MLHRSKDAKRDQLQIEERLEKQVMGRSYDSKFAGTMSLRQVNASNSLMVMPTWSGSTAYFDKWAFQCITKICLCLYIRKPVNWTKTVHDVGSEGTDCRIHRIYGELPIDGASTYHDLQLYQWQKEEPCPCPSYVSIVPILSESISWTGSRIERSWHPSDSGERIIVETTIFYLNSLPWLLFNSPVWFCLSSIRHPTRNEPWVDLLVGNRQ